MQKIGIPIAEDNHPEDKQVVIVVLMAGDIGCEVFPRNFHDAKTLRIDLHTLSQRFRIRRIIVESSGNIFSRCKFERNSVEIDKNR